MAIELSTSNRPNILPQQTERISYIESYGNYVKLKYDNGDHKLIRCSLKSFLESLPKNCFVRIHNQRIVNLSRIVRYNQTAQGINLILQDIDIKFKVSRTYTKSFLVAYRSLSEIPFTKNDPGYCF